MLGNFKGISLVAFFLVGVLHAHGERIVGKVVDVDEGQLVVEVGMGIEARNVTIKVNKHTTYRRGKIDVTASDLKPGDRVVMDIEGEGNDHTAIDIRITSKVKKKKP